MVGAASSLGGSIMKIHGDGSFFGGTGPDKVALRTVAAAVAVNQTRIDDIFQFVIIVAEAAIL